MDIKFTYALAVMGPIMIVYLLWIVWSMWMWNLEALSWLGGRFRHME